MILKNVVPQDVMAAIEDYVANSIDSAITASSSSLVNYVNAAIAANNTDQIKGYIVASDNTTNAVTNLNTSTYTAISCTLTQSVAEFFTASSSVVTYVNSKTIDAVINVVISGYNTSSAENIAGFLIYKKGAAIPSSIVTDVILDSGSSVSFMCGAELSPNDTIEVYAKAFGDSFNFELENINISITQVS